MKKSLTSIISDVRKVIDDMQSDSAFITDEQNSDATLESIIKHKAIEAADFAHLHADLALLALDETVQSTAATSQFLLGKPVSAFSADNMLRFVLASANTWQRAVSKLTPFASTECALAFDDFVGATTGTPVAVLVSSNSSRTVALYPQDRNAGIQYIPRATLGSDNSLAIDSNIYPQFINYLAAITLASLGDQRDSTLLNLAYSQLGIPQ